MFFGFKLDLMAVFLFGTRLVLLIATTTQSLLEIVFENIRASILI